jgi:hypothetical protein
MAATPAIAASVASFCQLGAVARGIGDSFQVPADAPPCAVETGVFFGFAVPGSVDEEVAKTGRGFALRFAKMLDMVSEGAISGCPGELSGWEERRA